MSRRIAKIDPSLFMRMKKKASASPSQYRISCVALDKKGDVIGYTTNGFRKDNIRLIYGSGLHSEAICLAKYYPLGAKTLIIMRIGNAGDVLPIDPCEQCQKMANKLGVKILSVMPGVGPKHFHFN